MNAVQLNIEFPTQSPININSIKGQNKRLYEYLKAGNRVTMFDGPRIGVGYMNSRISDLRNRCGLIIYDRFVTVNDTTVKQYSLTPFNK